MHKIMMTVDKLRDKAMMHLGFNIGCRVSEVISFTQESIDWQTGTIRIWDEKKNIYRRVTPPWETLNLLKMHINEAKTGIKPVFNIRERAVNRAFQKWCRKAVGFQRSWHSVRTTYITKCAENEVNARIVCENTGDSLETILKYYTKLSQDYIREKVEEKPVYTDKGLT